MQSQRQGGGPAQAEDPLQHIDRRPQNQRSRDGGSAN